MPRWNFPRHELNNLRRKRNNLHELRVAQLAGHRSEHARAHRFPHFVDQNGGIRIEADVGAILAPGFFPHPNDYAADHFTLLDSRFRRGFLHAGGDDVAQARAQSQVAAARQDAHQLARAAVVGHLEHCPHPDHGFSPLSSRPEGSRYRLPFFLVTRFSGPVTIPMELRSVVTWTAWRTISPRRQRFSLLMGRHSMMRTTSPTLAAPSSSCA